MARTDPGLEDAPNVLPITLDDVGFGQLGCYRGLIDTPNIDRLTEHHLRYNNFHTTALCSPTRSCLVTGRNQFYRRKENAEHDAHRRYSVFMSN